MSETLRTADGRTVLCMERHLAHPPERVWRALVEPEQLRAWFPVPMTAELRVGGIVRFSFEDGDSTVSEGTVTVYDPPQVLSYTWEDDLLRWEVQPDGDGTRLTLTHTFGDREGAASFASGWHTCIGALDVLLTGRPVPAAGGWETMHDLHESYVEAFGLGEATVEDAEDGWRVRVERQFTVPAEAVWAALTGDAEPVTSAPAPAGFSAQHLVPGGVTEAKAPALLEYAWRHGDRDAGVVRWELAPGPGGAARLTLTQTGPAHLVGERSSALQGWEARVRELASALRLAP